MVYACVVSLGLRASKDELGKHLPELVLLNLVRMKSIDLKNGLERCVLRFSTICAKNQVLNLIIHEVTEILRRK